MSPLQINSDQQPRGPHVHANGHGIPQATPDSYWVLKENLGDMHGGISRNRLTIQGEFMGRFPPGRASERVATIVKL